MYSGSPKKREEKREKGAKSLFEEMKVENFPNWMKEEHKHPRNSRNSQQDVCEYIHMYVYVSETYTEGHYDKFANSRRQREAWKQQQINNSQIKEILSQILLVAFSSEILEGRR